jgi:uroporphyrinogen decarboxylase
VNNEESSPLRESRFLKACRGEAVDRPPLWIMRQAGRYLPEYHVTRAKAGGFFELCRTPELAVEVTMQPIRRFGFDASILFSDILIPAEAMGLNLAFKKGEGPSITNPVRSKEDLARLRDPNPEEACPYVYETIRLLVQELAGTPLITFAAAPFTLACYMVEGKTSKTYLETRKFLYAGDGAGQELLDRIARYTIGHLAAGVRAGASAVMLFESWGGLLGPARYEQISVAYTRRIFEGVRAELGELARDLPCIYYVQGAPYRFEAIQETGASVFAIDWKVPIAEATRRLGGPGTPIQGNLDPAILLTSPAIVREEALAVLRAARGARASHIMNLGHGITPTTPIENVEALVETVAGFAAEGGDA